MIILDGKATADVVKGEIALEVQKIVAQGGKIPHLAAILVGEDGASQTYVGHKEKACAQVGFKSTLLRFPGTISEEFLLSEIEKINKDGDIDGLIVQLPLPSHIDEQKITEAIDPEKDVDGFHPVNVGKMVLGYYWEEQYRRQAYGKFAVSKIKSRRLHSYNVSQQNQKFE